MSELGKRKSDHIEICATQDVEHQGTTLLEDVHFFHDAVPERSLDEVDLTTELLGRRLAAPILISAMTGGTEQAAELNRALATVAQKCGLGMGVGSQRAMLLDPEQTQTYSVRQSAPDILLLANLGAVQARDHGPEAGAELVANIGADALCIHLNVAQELVQDEGDRDFRGSLETIEAFVSELDVPVVVKETGCGLSPGTLERLHACGVRWVDVSGAGGTSWTAVEAMRGSPRQEALGQALRNWGTPTAASIVFARRAGMHTIASGGIRSGLDAARALALGAEAVSLALPFLRAFKQGGEMALQTRANAMIEELRAITLLCGQATSRQLENTPLRLGAQLRSWLDTPLEGTKGF